MNWSAINLPPAIVVQCVFFSDSYSSSSSSSIPPPTSAFRRFQRSYLLVYLLMMSADWLQGPYVYALYQHYGFDIGQIGVLFIVGFGSSLVFGTIVGSMADRYGRRLARIDFFPFAIAYGCNHFSKHHDSSWQLHMMSLRHQFTLQRRSLTATEPCCLQNSSKVSE